MKATASATISFMLVNIPVKLYLAASPEKFEFNMLSPKDKARVKQQLVCSKSGKIIARDECLKGYEYAKNQFVIFTQEELKNLESERSTIIDIKEFIPLSTIDHVQCEKSYYLGADKGGDKSYRLFTTAMIDAGVVAVGKWAAKGKDQLVVIRPYNNGLILHQMYYSNEVRTFENTAASVPVRDDEKALALELIKRLTNDTFDSSKYYDEYRERVAKAVEKKAAGETFTVASSLPAATVLDVVSALKASLNKAPVKKTKKKAG